MLARDRIGPSMAKQRRKKLSDQVRQAVKDSPLSGYRISKETGIDQSHLSKFRRGECSMSLDCLDRLANVLHLEIAVRPEPTQTKGR